MTDLNNAKVLIISSAGFEQSELEFPRDQLRAKGATVHVATPDGTAIKGWDGDDWGDVTAADAKIEDIDIADFDALVLPGGQINPDLLRAMPAVVDKIRAFADSGKPVAAICHAPWLLIEADVIKGRKATSYHSISTDMKNAGAVWEDSEVVCDKALITSRNPDDLDAFCAKIIEEVKEGRHKRAA